MCLAGDFVCTRTVSWPEEALKVVRYHSLYAWHSQHAYAELESRDDRMVKGWVKLFQMHDLYSKDEAHVDVESVREYYDALIARFIPHGLTL